MVAAISRASIGSSPGCPAAPCSAAIRFATSTRKGADLAGVDLERRARPGRNMHACIGHIRGVQLLKALIGEGMQAGAEKRLHLFRSHRIADVKAADTGQARADPRTRTLSVFDVSRRQVRRGLSRWHPKPRPAESDSHTPTRH